MIDSFEDDGVRKKVKLNFEDGSESSSQRQENLKTESASPSIVNESSSQIPQEKKNTTCNAPVFTDVQNSTFQYCNLYQKNILANYQQYLLTNAIVLQNNFIQRSFHGIY